MFLVSVNIINLHTGHLETELFNKVGPKSRERVARGYKTILKLYWKLWPWSVSLTYIVIPIHKLSFWDVSELRFFGALNLH